MMERARLRTLRAESRMRRCAGVRCRRTEVDCLHRLLQHKHLSRSAKCHAGRKSLIGELGVARCDNQGARRPACVAQERYRDSGVGIPCSDGVAIDGAMALIGPARWYLSVPRRTVARIDRRSTVCPATRTPLKLTLSGLILDRIRHRSTQALGRRLVRGRSATSGSCWVLEVDVMRRDACLLHEG